MEVLRGFPSESMILGRIADCIVDSSGEKVMVWTRKRSERNLFLVVLPLPTFQRLNHET